MDRGPRIATTVARVAVGGVFIYAGLAKAADPATFIRDIWNYRILSEQAAYWIAAYLPYLEIFAGIALIAGVQRRGARMLIAALLVGFVAFLASAWARGLDISCGCFGTDPSKSSSNLPLLIARNLLLGAGLAFEAWTGTKEPPEAVPPGRVDSHPGA